jgi:hypothetical protein
MSWNDFLWALFYYKAIGGDEAYFKLVSNTQFKTILNSPRRSFTNDFVEKCLIKFLNKWNTRIDSNRVKTELTIVLKQIKPFVAKLNKYKIASVNFEDKIVIDGRRDNIENFCSKLFYQVDDITGIGPTATSKILHVLIPSLFTMWDKSIFDEFHHRYAKITFDGQGYIIFLRELQHLISNLIPNPSLGEQSIEKYVALKLQYQHPKTLAKLIDEYNWITITKKIQVPPVWHP